MNTPRAALGFQSSESTRTPAGGLVPFWCLRLQLARPTMVSTHQPLPGNEKVSLIGVRDGIGTGNLQMREPRLLAVWCGEECAHRYDVRVWSGKDFDYLPRVPKPIGNQSKWWVRFSLELKCERKCAFQVVRGSWWSAAAAAI